MMRHLSEDDLIRFQFDLAGGRSDEMGAHLAECKTCSSRLDQLRQKFASLDLLKDEIRVSDELIAATVSRVRRPAGRTRFISNRNCWMAVAAAVLLTGSLIFAVYHNINNPGDRIAKVATPQETAPDPFRVAPTNIVAEGKVVSRRHSLFRAPPADEKPPFAPASAIELVVLPRRDKVQLTIYNSADLTLVREQRNLTMKKGWNWLQFMWANTLIDPTSLSLEPLAQKDKIDVQQLVYPARLKEIGRWLIRSEVDGQVPFEITYFTSGLKWRAFYMGTLSADEKTMLLAGHVRVDNNSGEDYENARTRLIVGKINILDEIAQLAKRQYAYGRPGVLPSSSKWGDFDGDDAVRLEEGETVEYLYAAHAVDAFRDFEGRPKEIRKEGLSEYFLYTIEGAETIPNTWGKRLPSFEAEDIPVESLYKYDDARWGVQTVRFLKFANDSEHELGDTPIPDGAVKIYAQADSDGYLSYVGGTNVKYIPVNDEVELNLGAARRVKVEPVLLDFATSDYDFNKQEDIVGWDEIRTWKISVTNTRDIPVKIEVFRNFGTTYWDIEKSGQFDGFETEDMDTVKFTLDMAARSKKEFQYVITTHHGTREEAWTKSRR